MQQVILDFDTEHDLREAAKKLWDGYKVTGEMAIRPLGNGRWRLELSSEKELRDSTLEKLNGQRVVADRAASHKDEGNTGAEAAAAAAAPVPANGEGEEA